MEGSRQFEQFENHPYPSVSLEKDARTEWRLLFEHQAAHALTRAGWSLADAEGARILDYGCGTGYCAQVLSIANPGAALTAVDASPASIEIAQRRLAEHGIESDCRVVESPDRLQGQEFDYINCSEVAYLHPSPEELLTGLGKLLSKNGVLRVNFHNERQRIEHNRAQRALRLLGVTGECIDDETRESVRNLGQSLKPGIPIQRAVFAGRSRLRIAHIAANHLLEGDRSFSFREVLDLLDRSHMRLLEMVDHPRWITATVLNQGSLNENLKRALRGLTREERYELVALLGYDRRLFDLWAVRHDLAVERESNESGYTPRCVLALNPILASEPIVAGVHEALSSGRGYAISSVVPGISRRYHVDHWATCIIGTLQRGSTEFGSVVESLRGLLEGVPSSSNGSASCDPQAIAELRVRELQSLGLVFTQRP